MILIGVGIGKTVNRKNAIFVGGYPAAFVKIKKIQGRAKPERPQDKQSQ